MGAVPRWRGSYLGFQYRRDRDQAFIDLDGVVLAMARRGLPKWVIIFDDKYPSLLGLTSSGWGLDRGLLVELDKAAWDSVVSEFCEELPDPVIEDAVRKLPQPYYEIVGETLAEALKSRRDALPQFASRYYALITRRPEIQATDKNEYAQCEHTPNGDLVVRIGLIVGDGERKAPYFQRTFHPKETREVRIYLRGGDDHVEISGTKGRITVRIDGGSGDDTFTNASEAGASKTQFYDYRGENQFLIGKGVKVDETAYKRPSSQDHYLRYAQDWGMETFTFPTITVNPDLGLFVRFHNNRQYFGYRKDPFASRHDFNIGLATNGLEPFISYTGNFRHLLPNLDADVHFKYSGMQLIRFNGLGNDTPLPGSSAFYKVEQSHFVFAPSLKFQTKEHDGEMFRNSKELLRSELTLYLGPILKYSYTSPDAPDANGDRFIDSLDHQQRYGIGSFGQVGASSEIMYDKRDDPVYTSRGFLVRGSGTVYPGAWNVVSTFCSIDGEVRTYLTAPIPTNPTLALRVGGKKVWGTFPFHESAFLGGPGFVDIGSSDSHLRGFRKNRFAGDTSLYGNAELRFVLLPIKLIVPGEFGLFIAADAGRVFYVEDPDDADKWHTGVGGGFWFSFLQRKQTLSVAVVNGDDLTGVYLRAGFMF